MSTTEEFKLLSHLYPEINIIPQQPGEGKQRRRRKKAKVETGGDVARKRKLTQQQIHALELNFNEEHKLESERKEKLAMELGLEPRQVAVWFQNRRARFKNQKLEDEYLQLKAKHDSDVAQKCQLEMEVLKLKEQLANAEKVSRNLIAEISWNNDVCVPSNSPSSSSFSVETMYEGTDPFLGNFMMGGEDNNMYYVPENDYSYINIQESNNSGWVNLFDG